MPDWSELRDNILEGDLILPGDDDYAECVKRWNQAVETKPAVIVRPARAGEVSIAVRFAASNKTPLAVCGGGHSTAGTSSSDGMVIHLRRMRQVCVNKADMTVSFGGGCLWSDVDSALDVCGLATVGGTVNHTSVGGLILGGGHGWLTAKHGLAIDNPLSVEVATADGSILNASDKENSDLFWGIRGAGAHIGVVTQFTSRVHRQGKVWSGILTYDALKLPEIVDFANEFHNRDDRKGHCLTIAIGRSMDDGSPILSAIPLYLGPERDGKIYFSRLLDIGPLLNSTRTMSIAEVNTLHNPMCEYGMRRLQGSGNIKMPLKLAAIQLVAGRIWDLHEKFPDISVCTLAIELFPTHKLREVANNATAYANRGDYYDAVTLFGWTDPKLDMHVRKFNRELCETIRTSNGYVRSRDAGSDGFEIGPVGRYLNMEVDSLSVDEGFGMNSKRFQDLKLKFDPCGTFQKVPGID